MDFPWNQGLFKNINVWKKHLLYSESDPLSGCLKYWATTTLYCTMCSFGQFFSLSTERTQTCPKFSWIYCHQTYIYPSQTWYLSKKFTRPEFLGAKFYPKKRVNRHKSKFVTKLHKCHKMQTTRTCFKITFMAYIS